MTLTAAEKEKAAIVARFTPEEKDVLFKLFKEYEHIIDIKYRKKSRRKTMEVRQCWQEILDSYNSNPQTTTQRNLKQLQKFWLNARLRKRYPCGNEKDRKVYMKNVAHAATSTSHNTGLSYQQQSTPTSTERRIKYEFQILNDTSALADVSQKDGNESRQVSIETASNDNISINDLLEFKNTNSQIVEVKTIQNNADTNQDDSEDNTIYYDNEINGEEENARVTTSKVWLTHVEPIQKSPERQHANLGTSKFYTNSENTAPPCCRCSDERIKAFCIKEAELKFREQKLKYEKQRVELAKSQEELKYMKEMHKLQLQELRKKLKTSEPNESDEK